VHRGPALPEGGHVERAQAHARDEQDVDVDPVHAGRSGGAEVSMRSPKSRMIRSTTAPPPIARRVAAGL